MLGIAKALQSCCSVCTAFGSASSDQAALACIPITSFSHPPSTSHALHLHLEYSVAPSQYLALLSYSLFGHYCSVAACRALSYSANSSALLSSSIVSIESLLRLYPICPSIHPSFVVSPLVLPWQTRRSLPGILNSFFSSSSSHSPLN